MDSQDRYKNSKTYWESVPATVDGMLGGFTQISSADISGSNKFLRQFLKGPNAKTKSSCALDCGAGIGRVTKRLLLPLFETVDLVDQNQNFLNESKNFIGEQSSRIERYICSGLQDFSPEPGRYDVIWCQWILMNLADDDLVAFFVRCKAGLAAEGLIIIKENINSSDVPDFDEEDCSFARPRNLFIDLAKKAGLSCIKEEKQKSMPKDIYEVRMFAFQ